MIFTCTCLWSISGIYELLLKNTVCTCNTNVQRSKETAVVCSSRDVQYFDYDDNRD